MLLFAASDDLCNVMETLLDLSYDYQGKRLVVINDRNLQVVARNVVMLLISLHLDTATAVPLIIYTWYLVLVPADKLQFFQSSILPLITSVCDKIKYRPLDMTKMCSDVQSTIALFREWRNMESLVAAS